MSDPSVLRLLMRMSTLLEPDESMGEDARSIAYFDMYVFLTNAASSFPFLEIFFPLLNVELMAIAKLCLL